MYSNVLEVILPNNRPNPFSSRRASFNPPLGSYINFVCRADHQVKLRFKFSKSTLELSLFHYFHI